MFLSAISAPLPPSSSALLFGVPLRVSVVLFFPQGKHGKPIMIHLSYAAKYDNDAAISFPSALMGPPPPQRMPGSDFDLHLLFSYESIYA